MFTIFFYFLINIYGSAKMPDDRKKKKSKEDEQISAGLSYAHLRLQAKCQQTSYIKRIKVFFFAI